MISEKGASTIGAPAKPMQKIVIPVLNATLLTFQSGRSCDAVGVSWPAEYAASVVTAQANQVTNDLRVLDQRKGDVYFFKFGHGGGSDVVEGFASPLGTGSSVEKSR